MLAARIGKDYELGTGTSAAAPFIAGAIAILKQANPNASFEEIRKALASTKTFVKDVQYQDLPLIDFSTAIPAIQTGVFSNKTVKPIDIEALQIEKSKAESDAKLAKEAQTKAESDLKLAKDAQAKSEADAKLAKEAQAKSETDLKAAQLVLTQVQQETSKLKSEFEAIRIQVNELASSSSLLQKENASLKKKLSAICKIKPKPKGC
jgi:subtilisin family serine protease